MDKESKNLIDVLVNLCWYMRGGLSLEDAYRTTAEEREIIMSMVSKHIDVSKETGQMMI